MVPLRLDLSALKPGHNRLDVSVAPEDLGLPSEAWPTPLAVHLDADRAGDEVHVTAQVTVESAEECARCLRDFRAPLEFALTVYADRSGSGGRYERELAQDDDIVFHDGRFIELAKPVREAAILARPMAPLCRPDCRGLCPECGADRNEGPCPHGAGAPSV
jgi:uncharacterized protein